VDDNADGSAGPPTGAVFPASVILLALITTVITVVVIVRRRNMDRDWEISYDELDVREQLGVRNSAAARHT
jgi:hypothetical protein